MGVLEDLLISRGTKAFKGKINPWDLPQFAPSVEGIRTEGAMALEDLGSALRKSDVRGPAAGTLLGKMGEQTEGNILNLATNLAGVPESYIGQGALAEQAKEKQALQEKYLAFAKSEAHKGRKERRKMAQFQSMEGMGTGSSCCWIFNADGKLTQAVRDGRDTLFGPESYVARGYKAMAQWLVPVIHRHKSVRLIVRWSMLNPISKFCEKKNPALIPICVAWAFVWEFYGRINDFCNYPR